MKTTHSFIARFSHWLSAIAIIILGASGLEIFMAFPSFGTKLPQSFEIPVPSFLTLGGWLGGALSWHLAFAWIFAGSFALYIVDLLRGGWRRIWLSAEEYRGIWPMARYYFLRGPKPDVKHIYNPLQKSAYLAMTAAMAGALVTGATLAQPVQLRIVVSLLGGWQNLRIAHFACLCAFAGFLPGHLVMVAIAGRSALWTMISGRTAAPVAGAPARSELVAR